MPRSVTVRFYFRASQPRKQSAKLVMYSGLKTFDIRTTKVGRDVVISHLFAVSLIYTHASQDSLWQSAGLVIERLRVRIPAGAAGEFSAPELTLCSLIRCPSHPLSPQ